MRRIYLSVTASAVLLTACSTQHDATPQEQAIPHQMIEQQNNGQLNIQQQSNQMRNQTESGEVRNKGTAIDADEHFLTDMTRFYDNEKYENDDIQLYIDGMHLHTNPSAFIDGDEVYIPISFVSSHLEAGVRYDKESNMIEIHRGESDVDLYLENDQASVNGVKESTPNFITREGTVFVPICFVAEALGYSVEKNIEDDEVLIETHQPEAATFSFTDQIKPEELSIPVQATMNKESYTVQAEDSLSVIAKKFNTTVDRLKELNNLSSDMLRVGQVLVVFSRPDSYTVVSGDSLFSIARKFELTVEQLQRYNQLTTTTINPGQRLSLVQPSSYIVKQGDTLYSIAKSFGVTVESIKNWNNLSEEIKVGQTLVVTENTTANPPKNETQAPKAETQTPTNQNTYAVQAGDSLFSIAKRFNTTVENVKSWNNLTSNLINVGQTLVVEKTTSNPTKEETPAPANQNTYTVQAGDSLYSIAKRFNTTVQNVKSLNNLTSDIISVGQKLTIVGEEKTETETPEPAPVKQPQPSTQQKTYTVVKGDTLLGIAKRFNITVEELKRLNGLRYDDLMVGRTLIVVPSGDSDTEQEGVTVSFKTHTVQSGDNLWKLSVQYGIPMLELAKENNLSVNSSLSIGQKLTVPVYHVPVKSTVSQNHGELLDWWTEARYVFPIGTVATAKDVKTGRTFKVKHTMGGNHADAEPLTANDTKIMKEIWGGSFSWTPRAVILTVNGRQLAAAMHSYPHSSYDIKDNNYNGHFCIHFLNSTRHNDGLIQDSMQKQIQISAGVQ